MPRKRSAKKGSLLQQISVNTVLAGILVALLTYFIFGFFQTEEGTPTILPGAQFALPMPTVSSSDDSQIRKQLRSLQVKLRNTGFLSTRSELSVLYMEAVQQGLIAPTQHDVEWLRALSLFGKNVDVEKPRIPEVIAIAVIYERLLQPEKAIEHFKEALELLLHSGTDSERVSYAAFCYDRLAELQVQENAREDAVRTYAEALSTRTDDRFANRWYGRMVETQIILKDYEGAKKACDKCITELTGTTVPYNCLHSRGMIAAWFGDIELATNRSISTFSQLVEHSWKRDMDSRPCKGQHFPITYDHFSEEDRALVPGMTGREIPVPPGVAVHCSGQKWPFVLKKDRNTGTFEVSEAQLIFDEMQCITSDDKVPMLYTLEDVVVKGDGKIISSDAHCAVYSFGYPYQNTRFHPRLEGKDDYNVLQLPFIDLEEAIVLHSQLDENYYHLMVEGSSMPMLLQFVDRDAWTNSKILLKAHRMSANFLEHSQVPVTALQRYDPELARYRVKKLHVVDWKFLDSSVYHHPSDYYVPPANVINLVRKMHMNGQRHPGINETVARDAVIYVHRDTTSTRSISNWQALVDRLNSTAIARGLDLIVHDGSGTVRQQIELFKRAVAVVGPHGAGLANILFCEQTTAVIELRSKPKAVSEYSRMASALNLEYWNVPYAELDRYQRGAHLSPSQISSVSRTLDYVLFDRGHRDVCGEEEVFTKR